MLGFGWWGGAGIDFLIYGHKDISVLPPGFNTDGLKDKRIFQSRTRI